MKATGGCERCETARYEKHVLIAPSSNGSSIAVELITSNKNFIASETSEGRGPEPDHGTHPASSD